MNYLEEYNKAFNSVCKTLGLAIKKAITKTEKDIKRKLTKKEKEDCIKIGVAYAFFRALQQNDKKPL